MLEDKVTDAASYRLTLADLKTLQKNAAAVGKLPLFRVNFRDRGTFFVIDEAWLLQLLGKS